MSKACSASASLLERAGDRALGDLGRTTYKMEAASDEKSRLGTDADRDEAEVLDRVGKSVTSLLFH